jgi:hypothetical protein
MVVRITNITDGPRQKPKEFRVYNKKLRPGQFIDIPPQYVDARLRESEKMGYIAIGRVPPWYSDYQAKRKVRNLTRSEIKANVDASKAYKASREAAKAATKKLKDGASPQPKKKVAETSDDVSVDERFDLSDESDDQDRGSGRKKRR